MRVIHGIVGNREYPLSDNPKPSHFGLCGFKGYHKYALPTGIFLCFSPTQYWVFRSVIIIRSIKKKDNGNGYHHQLAGVECIYIFRLDTTTGKVGVPGLLPYSEYVMHLCQMPK